MVTWQTYFHLNVIILGIGVFAKFQGCSHSETVSFRSHVWVMLPYVHRADGQKDQRTKLRFNKYIQIPAPSKGWCFNPKGLFNGTPYHPFGTPWRVQIKTLITIFHVESFSPLVSFFLLASDWATSLGNLVKIVLASNREGMNMLNILFKSSRNKTFKIF